MNYTIFQLVSIFSMASISLAQPVPQKQSEPVANKSPHSCNTLTDQFRAYVLAFQYSQMGQHLKGSSPVQTGSNSGLSVTVKSAGDYTDKLLIIAQKISENQRQSNQVLSRTVGSSLTAKSFNEMAQAQKSTCTELQKVVWSSVIDLFRRGRINDRREPIWEGLKKNYYSKGSAVWSMQVVGAKIDLAAKLMDARLLDLDSTRRKDLLQIKSDYATAKSEKNGKVFTGMTGDETSEPPNPAQIETVMRAEYSTAQKLDDRIASLIDR